MAGYAMRGLGLSPARPVMLAASALALVAPLMGALGRRVRAPA